MGWSAGYVGIFTQAQLVYSGTLAALSGTTVPAAPLMSGARALMVVPLAGLTGASKLELIGALPPVGSGAVYLMMPAGAMLGQLPIFAPFDSTADSKLTALGAGTAGPGSVAIYALGDPVAIAGSYPKGATPGRGNRLLVAGVDSSTGGVLELTVDDSTGGLVVKTAFPSTTILVDPGGANEATVTVAGALKVDGSAVTQPVSGTVGLTAGQAVELLDSAGANRASISAAGAVKVDGSAVTQPVSGTVTANQGTAGGTAWPVVDGAISGLKSVNANASVAASATSTVIAAVGGQKITVYGFVFSVAAAAATAGAYLGQLQSGTSSVAVAALRTQLLQASAVGIGSDTEAVALWIPNGLPLPVGESLVFSAGGNAGSIVFAATVFYTQA